MAAKQPVTSTAPPLSEYVADRALALHDAINAQTGQNCADINNCALLDTCKRALKAAEARGIERAAEIVYGVLVHDETPDDAELALKDAIRRIRALLTPTEDGGAGK